MSPCPKPLYHSAGGRPPRPSLSPSRGAVLLLVLGFIALTTMIVTAFLSDAADRVRLSTQFNQRDDLRIEAYGAFDIALAALSELREIDGELFSPAQGWGDPLNYAGVVPAEGITLSVRVTDEGGKFGLRRLDETTLRALFEELGFEFMVAEELTDCLLDWIDGDDETRLNGAERDWYEDLPEPYRPSNSAPKSWDEFQLIKGFDTAFFDEEGRPNGLFRAFREAVSLHHSEPVNLNTAGDLVLATLARMEGFDPETVRRHLAGDDGVRGTADDRAFRQTTDPALPLDLRPQRSAGGGRGGARGEAAAAAGTAGIRASVFTVSATAQRGDARFQVEAVVQWQGVDRVGQSADTPARRTSRTNRSSSGDSGAQDDRSTALGYPFKILLWRENSSL